MSLRQFGAASDAGQALDLTRLGDSEFRRSYREIAEGLFGPERVRSRSWKDHDLRSLTIRLVKNGIALMRGGYRALLRSPRRKK